MREAASVLPTRGGLNEVVRVLGLQRDDALQNDVPGGLPSNLLQETSRIARVIKTTGTENQTVRFRRLCQKLPNITSLKPQVLEPEIPRDGLGTLNVIRIEVDAGNPSLA